MIEYKIIRSSDADDLEKIIQAAIIADWRPQGGVTATLASANTNNPSRIMYAQAIVRERKEQKKDD